MYLLSTFLFLINLFVSENVDVVGSYEFISKDGKSIVVLNVKKDSYTLNSEDKFKGSYTEYGSWELKSDTLILKSESRKDKYNKNSSYNTNYRKQKYEYIRVEYFKVFTDQVCYLNTSLKGKGNCFMKK